MLKFLAYLTSRSLPDRDLTRCGPGNDTVPSVNVLDLQQVLRAWGFVELVRPLRFRLLLRTKGVKIEAVLDVVHRNVSVVRADCGASSEHMRVRTNSRIEAKLPACSV